MISPPLVLYVLVHEAVADIQTAAQLGGSAGVAGPGCRARRGGGDGEEHADKGGSEQVDLHVGRLGVF